MGYLNKVALAHFDLPDLLKSNYFDPRSAHTQLPKVLFIQV